MTTNNHPAHGPVSLERLHQISEHLQHDTQYSNGGNRAYILADVLKVIDGAIASFGAEPVAVNDDMAYAFHRALSDSSLGADEVEEIKTGLRAAFANVTTQPAPEPMKAHQIRELVNDLRDIAVEYHGTQQLRERIARTVRAAMLKGESK